jgi:hypothetical protein
MRYIVIIALIAIIAFPLALIFLASEVSQLYAQFPPTMSDRGYVEGYSHWPMSFPYNSTYVDAYKMGVRDYKWTFQDKAWTFLGTLPAHSTDNYKDFYLGEQAGGDAYCNPTMHKCPAWEGGWKRLSNIPREMFAREVSRILCWISLWI